MRAGTWLTCSTRLFSGATRWTEAARARFAAGCPALGAYLTCYAIQAGDPVLVRIEGPESEDTPCDADAGEVLLLPTSAQVVEDDEQFFEVVSALVDAYWEDGLTGIRDLTDLAESLGL